MGEKKSNKENSRTENHVPHNPESEGLSPFQSNAKGLLLTKRTVNNTGCCHTLFKGQYSQWSSPQKFTTLLSLWERGFLFQRFRHCSQSLSLHEGIRRRGLFLMGQRESFNQIPRQTESEAGKPNFSTWSAQEISKASNTVSLFLPLLACRKRIPVSTWGVKMLLISTDRLST